MLNAERVAIVEAQKRLSYQPSFRFLMNPRGHTTFFQKRESDINTNTNLMKRWAGLFTRNEQIISLFKSGCFPPFPHVLLFLSFREGSKGQTIVEPSDILVNKSLTHASLLLWAFDERWGLPLGRDRNAIRS